MTASNNQSAPQLISTTVTYSGGTTKVTTVVNNPTPPTPPTAGAASQLFFYTQPGGAQSSQNLTPQPVVEVQDSSGTAVIRDLSDVVLSLTTTSGGAVPTGTTLSGCVGSENFGYVSFSGCNVNKVGTYELKATDSALGAGYSLQSNPFTITTGPPSQILFTQQPSNSTGGTAFATQPQITIEDAGGNTVTTDNTSSVALAVTTGSGSGALTCTTDPQTVTGGVATFSGCSVNTIGTTYTLTATDVETTGTLTATSATFKVSLGAPAQLAFTQNPTASTGGVAFGTQPKVAIEDAGGNVITTGNGATDKITIAINTSPGGAPALTCTQTNNQATAAAGVATFSGCKITVGTTPGTFTLKATDNSRTLPTGASTPFTVAGGATKLAFATQPTNTSTGATFTTAPVVWVEDSANDLVTNATNQVTLSIASGTGGTLGGCTGAVTPTGGIATFTGCKITLSGAGGTFTLKASANPTLTTATSNSFTVASAATKLVFTTQPTSSTGGVAFPTQPVVTVEDSSNDVVTSNTSAATLAITTGTGTSGAALSCTSNPLNTTAGVATFSNCSINLVGSGYTLKATDGTLTSATSSSLSITLGPAAQVRFTTQPNGGANAVAWTTQPSVTIADAGGNPVTTATNQVSLIVGTQPSSGATLGCTINPVTATSGVASFAGCEIVGKTGTYTLTATSPGLSSGNSGAFTITVGVAAQVAFTTQPGGGANTAAWTAQPKVLVEDSGGNTVTSGSSNVTLAIAENAGGILACTTNPVATTAGVATFAGCKITGTAGTYSLSAAAPGLTSGTSSTFTLTAGPATQVVFSTQPGGGGDGSAWTTQPAVSVEDVSGNIVGTSTANITLSIQSQPGSGATLGVLPILSRQQGGWRPLPTVRSRGRWAATR